jgi:hypothetical protein
MTGDSQGRAVLEEIRKRQRRELQEKGLGDFTMISEIRQFFWNSDGWETLEMLEWFDDLMKREVVL